MAIHAFEEQDPYDEDSVEVKALDRVTSSAPHATKRQRWATHRAKKDESISKRRSILRRFKHESSGGATTSSVGGSSDDDNLKKGGGGGGGDDSPASPAPEGVAQPRTVYFNQPLPADARDEDGHPLAQYARNKVRTSKYTPLTFVPKNLFLQFHNIANIYFLLTIILSAFQIFGASNPGLNAVPLIVIIVLTAIKDGIEDTRRTILDNELNNSPVHRLVGIENVNTSEDKVSLWRRFKKANSRFVASSWSFSKRVTASKKSKAAAAAGGKGYADRAVDAPRPSYDAARASTSSQRFSEEYGVELTPVGSPRSSGDLNGPSSKSGATHSSSPFLDVPGGGRGDEKRQSGNPLARDYGSLINPHREATGKAVFRKDAWKDIQVGDFVRLYNEEAIPADIVVLNTSDPDGACYVETKNLDGETNLKVRQALHAGRKIKRARECERAEFLIESEAPQPNLYAYSAVARWVQRDPRDPDAAPTQMAEPIGPSNLLLRGCSVRNTEWVLGVVVFTGDETKIVLNSGITPTKRAKISRDLNWNVIYNFIILFLMCLVTGIVNGTSYSSSRSTQALFEFGSYGGTPGLNGLITFWAAVILFQNLVPISLYISLEIIRTFQAFFIYSDYLMYYERLDYPCTPKSWNISDDLGQIEYIFSDKTGTLTQNVMEFKKATVAGVPYGEAYTEAQAGLQKRQGIDVEKEGAKARAQIAEDRERMLQGLRRIHDNPYLRDDDLTFVAPDFVEDLSGASGDAQKVANERFMLALALCHTVITEKTPGDPPTIEFKAQSPDEAALVATARDCGFTVTGRTKEGIIVNVMGNDVEYTVLNTLEFNSTRKRMSAILRMPDGKIVLFCKGADSIIYARLAPGEQPEMRKTTAEHLELFAREGLRTLCIAQRELSEEEYQSWSKEHDLAAAAIQDREDKLELVSSAIEQNLTLLGGTAIEDRLQEGVPDAIALLANAGIKLWVLTGDKVETAINIGFSCNLLNNDMDLIIFRIEDDSYESAEAELDKHLKTFGLTGSDEELKAAKKNHEAPAPTHAIVIDGDSLKLTLSDGLRQKFLLLCKECKSVLCCRVSPAQKAAVVSLVKHGLDVMTLAIGDGANDVAMIQQADVGVGIAGEEGRQAVMTADFAIGQFRFLARLMLVHGRWCYRRLAEVIANFFYKNIVWTFALFWYCIYTDFDATYIFDYTYILLYNLAFTSLAIIFQGILDQDVSDKVSLAVPALYRRGIERLEWTQTKFWLYMADGFYQSLMVFFMTYLLFEPAVAVTENGLNDDDNYRIGVYIANGAVIIVNVYILLNTYHWDYAMLGVTLFSILLVFFWTGVYPSFTSSFQFYHAGPQVYGQLSFWALTLLAIVVCLLPRFLIKSFQKIFLPYDIDIIREQVRQHKFDYLNDKDPHSLLFQEKAPAGDELPEQRHQGAPHAAEPRDPASLKQLDAAYDGGDERRHAPPPPSTAGGQTFTTRGHNSGQGSDDTMGSLQGMAQQPADADAFSSFPRFTRTMAPPSQPSYEQDGAGAGRMGQPLAAVATNASSVYTPYNPSPNRDSLGQSPFEDPARPRPSYDRMRSSMDQLRPSFEQSSDMTTVAGLMKASNPGTSNLR